MSAAPALRGADQSSAANQESTAAPQDGVEQTTPSSSTAEQRVKAPSEQRRSNEDRQADDRQDKKSSDTSGQSSSKLPPWIVDNIKNPHSLKMLFRCWVASWVAILLLLFDRSLATLGQAAFFVCMVTVFLPANLPIFPWLIANGTLVVGSVVGWAIGCAAMAAALRARDSTLLQSQLQRVQASVATATNPEAEYQAAIFRAEFLDARSSAVFGVFLAFGSFLAAVVFTQSPKLRFTAIFMVIVLDVMCTYGVLFPVQQYTLGTIFLLPIGVSLGISFACMLFIFPETLSFGWQGNLAKLLKATKGYVVLHDAFLKELTTADDLEQTAKVFDGKLKGAQTGVIALLQAMQGQRPFLHMELTYSSLSPKDLTSLLEPVKILALRTLGLFSFNTALEVAIHDDKLADDPDAASDAEKNVKSDHEDFSKPVAVHDTHALMRWRGMQHEAERTHHVSLKDDMLPIMIDGSRDLLAKCFSAMDEITSWLEFTNNHRYLGQMSAEQHQDRVAKLNAAVEELEQTVSNFDKERLRLIAPYEKHFAKQTTDGSLMLDADGAKAFRSGARGLYICLVWCFNATNTAKQLIVLTRAVHDVALKRPRSRLWWPTGLSRLAAVITSKRGSDVVNSMPADDPDSEESTLAEDVEQDEREEGDNAAADATKKKIKAERRSRLRDADALPPSNALHYIGRFLAACYRFTYSQRGMFALRFTIAGLAVWIPSAATQESAAFSYRNRGLWAIIMAQLAVALTSGEFVFSIASRVIGTVLGALLGALLWYISCGKAAQGNPYGYGAVTAVAFVPLVFLRLFVPMQLLIVSLMTFVTLVLVIGYSWIDAGHLVISVSSGIGIEVAWRRMLLVLIGIAAGFIVMLFPRPTSTRETVRHSFAKLTSRRILPIYCKAIEAWSTHSEDSYDEVIKQDAAKSSPAMVEYRAELLAGLAQQGDLAGKVGLARLDVPFRGRWPAERYDQLLKTHNRMVRRIQ
ncbi:hypothetical protein BDZ90DRAFT_11781 [Jaminaea rosea]|uniref:ER transporter 6TM N-terminal domain-containing protein n=1 Tax=Jaminaea rosea TaxID=1569628 RepID=A0A316UZE4_9BASI|nr:hypothetical protein BDZ90DRAFT_11781 [Jaminaea rosea]PWN30364.1 hypothetical protein BDZ90DRAFT_11781 [Jaminaea rosea]